MNGIRLLCDVRDRPQADPPETLGRLDLNGDRDDRLRCRFPPVHGTLDTPDVRLVDLHPSAQTLAGRADHRHAKPVQHCPRRLVGPEPQRPLQPERRDSLLLAGHQPRRREPRRQRRARAVEDRSRRHRGLTATHGALPTTAAQSPAGTTDTACAAESVRPAQPLQVVDARVIVREPRQQLAVGARIVDARCRHEPRLPDSNG